MRERERERERERGRIREGERDKNGVGGDKARAWSVKCSTTEPCKVGAIAAQYVPCALSLLPISMPNSHLLSLLFLWSLRPPLPTWEEVKYMSVHAWVSMVCLYRCDAVGVKQTAMNPWRASSEKPFITTKKEEEERRKEEGRKEGKR
jgi:hypothetical protein